MRKISEEIRINVALLRLIRRIVELIGINAEEIRINVAFIMINSALI
jgi:hypothetical protein